MASELSKGTGKFISDLPGWAKGVVAIAILGGIGYTIYWVQKKRKENKNLEGAEEETKSVDKELKDASVKAPISRPQSEINEMANSLFTAMDGYGTNRERIYAVMAKVRNQTDVLALKKAFGIREISSGKWSPEPNLKGTLSQALAEELGKDEFNALNTMIAKKGIKSGF
jgi:hypothetical protein